MHKPSPRIRWTDELARLEAADWRNDPEAFRALCDFAVDEVVKRSRVSREDLDALMSRDDIEAIVRSEAAMFDPERHLSLLLRVWLGLRREVGARRNPE